MADPYKKPYFDSDVFIGWIKNEVCSEIGPDGKEIIIKRGEIALHLLTLAEHRVFPIVISALTFAEVHKLKKQPKLTGDENQNVLDYFENDFVDVVNVDRALGEEANKLCRQYEAEKLSPNDAIHMACAIKADCDILLSWDGVLNSINDPRIKIRRPEIWMPVKTPKLQMELADLTPPTEPLPSETKPDDQSLRDQLAVLAPAPTLPDEVDPEAESDKTEASIAEEKLIKEKKDERAKPE